jgi:hypothetical protein
MPKLYTEGFDVDLTSYFGENSDRLALSVGNIIAIY